MNGQRIPIARLVSVNDVSIILPLSQTSRAKHSCVHLAANSIAKPAVAKLKKYFEADRWHQRLGHVGPLMLSKTKDFAKGLGTLDTSELTHCEGCHLSKAQCSVSREKRPIPLDPLHEVFVDVVEPIEPNLLKQRYANIITDATTRMRSWLGTEKKDEIPA